MLRPSLFAWINLCDVAVRDHLIGKRADRAFAPFALPWAKFVGAHVLNKFTADDRHALGLNPLFIGTVLFHHELHVGMNFKLFLRTGHGHAPPSIRLQVTQKNLPLSTMFAISAKPMQ